MTTTPSSPTPTSPVDDGGPAKNWTLREDAHYNGGKTFFAYLMRCVQQPRLSRYDRYDKATKTSTSTWRVDGIDFPNFNAAIIALNIEPELTAEERLVLETVTSKPSDRRKEMIANYEPWHGLREKAFILWEKGRVTITDAGRAALLTARKGGGERV
ncbi:MAG: hypothetical protein J0I23_03800 [Rhizobiales bacterium]|nr:hypothetical protein [Hyphomicrobiales bacterium]